MRQTFLISAVIAGMFSQALNGEVPESAKTARAFFQSGRLEELCRLADADQRSKTSSQPVEAYYAGEALLACHRPADALEFAEKVRTSLPLSMVSPFLWFRARALDGNTGFARTSAVSALELSAAMNGKRRGWSALDWALLGKLKLAAGVDAKVVLETCYERALRDDPACEEAYEFIVELALSCGDSELAASRARDALKRFPKNATLFALLGNALQWGSPQEASAKWLKALELNPKQSIARSALAATAFALDDTAALDEQLVRLAKWDAEAGALRLACAYTGSSKETPAEVQSLLSKNAWALHRAGVLLSGRYLFSEGEQLQRKALALDPGLLPAKRALAQDLLRLGRSAEAWSILEEVHSKDGYDITAFNLLELRDRVANFTKLESPHFDVWMDPAEAAVYGDRVTQLLERAYTALTAKYHFKPPVRTTVEIFPEQKDFAVRTFGVPGGDGYLGVCFGTVITAPSPASPRAAGHSWEATLWHEFTHTLTLNLTRNRMPRWLSEGISVHEEQQANSGWGQRFRPRHAGRLLEGQFTPLERMSEAFRTGDSAELDFAYFQAGLIVDWMVKKSGPETLLDLLKDLGKGFGINAAIAMRYGPMSQLNADFSKYAAGWARDMAGSLHWKAAPQADVKHQPVPSAKPSDNFYEDILREGERAFAAKDFETARNRFESVLNRAPKVRDNEGAIFWLVKTYRALGLESEEIGALRRALESIADFTGAHERLIELYAKSKDWRHVAHTAAQHLGVSPMSIRVIEDLATAHEQLGEKALAVGAFERALKLDPDRAPRWHSKIGTLLEESAPIDARAHLLDALEVNPRDRTALEALTRIASRHPRSADPNSEPPQPGESKRAAILGSEKGDTAK